MKTIEPAARDLKKTGHDVKSDDGFNLPAPQAQRYWTLWRNDDDSEIMRAWKIPPRERPRLLHEGVCGGGHESPLKLMAELLGKGWAKDSFDKTVNRFALIEGTLAGITVTPFETYEAACKAHALSAR